MYLTECKLQQGIIEKTHRQYSDCLNHIGTPGEKSHPPWGLNLVYGDKTYMMLQSQQYIFVKSLATLLAQKTTVILMFRTSQLPSHKIDFDDKHSQYECLGKMRRCAYLLPSCYKTSWDNLDFFYFFDCELLRKICRSNALRHYHGDRCKELGCYISNLQPLCLAII